MGENKMAYFIANKSLTKCTFSYNNSTLNAL